MVNAVLAAREGFQAPTTEEFNWPCIDPGFNLFGSTVCLNRVGLVIILAALVTLAFFVVTFAGAKLVPGRRQSIGELGVEFIRGNIVMDVLGPKGLKFMPYLLTVFFFIFFANAASIVPGLNYPGTASTAVPALLAICTWFVYVGAGVRSHGLAYFRNTIFPPGIPAPLYLIMAPIEFISVFLVRPLTLTIRLAANMIAGHLVLAVFLLGTQYMLAPLWESQFSITEVWAVGAFAMAIALTGFELFVAGLQAFIFTILTAVYISSSLEAEH